MSFVKIKFFAVAIIIAVSVSMFACSPKTPVTPDKEPPEITKCEYENCDCGDCVDGCECGEEEPAPLEWNDELKTTIKRDYAGSAPIDYNLLIIAAYYGIYDDCVAVMMFTGLYEFLTATEIVAGKTFYFWDGALTIKIWRDGSFKGLGEAYYYGIITADDVAQIYDLYVESTESGELTFETIESGETWEKK